MKDWLVDWSITQACNFTCSYCHVSKKVADESINIDYVLRLLDSTEKTWTITLSGGEPTIHPKFLEVCKKLTQKHFIRINTNLANPKAIRRFVEVIDPKKVAFIDVSLHLRQRVQRDPELARLKTSIELLKAGGYPFKVNCVYHPDSAKELEVKIDELEVKLGSEIVPKRFKGLHKGRYFPLAYEREQKRFIKKHFEYSSNRLDYDYQNIPCSAGMNLIKIRANGDVYRCPGDKTPMGHLGNINQENVKLLSRPQLCNVGKCPCWGPNTVILNGHQKKMQRAIDAFMEDDYDKAVDIYTQAADDGDAIAMNNLHAIYKRLGDEEKAKENIKKAFETLPHNFIVLSNYIKTIGLVNAGGIIKKLPQEIKERLLKEFNTNPKYFALSRQIQPREDLKYQTWQSAVKDRTLRAMKKSKIFSALINAFLRTKAGEKATKLWRKS